MSQPIKNQFLALAGQVLPAAVGMISFMLLVRVLDQQVLGEYLIYMTTVVLFEMVKSGGLQSALIMRVSENDAEKRDIVVGSAYWFGALVVISSAVLLLAGYFLSVFRQGSGFHVFCLAYAVMGFITLPLHIAEAEAVAAQKLQFLLVLRLLQSLNPLLVAVLAWMGMDTLYGLVTVHVGFNALLLAFVLLTARTNPLLVFKRSKEEVMRLFHLVKYTLATLGTTNVLKSADTFLIGAIMGPAAVALYAIPLKLTELFEIPLRTLSTTAFPQLANRFNSNDKPGFRKGFLSYLTGSYLLYIPGLMLAFALAPFLVQLIGGKQYADTAGIFRVFVLFGFFLPLNRITGIVLDAMQKPGLNFIKVAIMALVNILADLAAIYLAESLNWVAFASVINAVTGCFLGVYFIKKSGLVLDSNVWNDIKQIIKVTASRPLNRLGYTCTK